eukprot:scaffold995_cov358-Pavlova_lutheri.AAC.6
MGVHASWQSQDPPPGCFLIVCVVLLFICNVWLGHADPGHSICVCRISSWACQALGLCPPNGCFPAEGSPAGQAGVPR